jgi:hypothetical protein
MSEDATSEETQEVVEEQELVTDADVLDSLEPDDLKKEIKKLRRENAKHRTAKQSKDAELEEFRAWKDSQLTVLERAQKRASELEAQLSTHQREKQQRDAAKKADLDPDLADRVRGDTFDEMVEDAKRLREKFPKSAVVRDAVVGSTGKKPVGSKAEDSNSWFADLLKGK